MDNLTQLMEQLRAKIDAYNTALSVIDSHQAEIEELEKALGNLSEEMLIGVAFQYGKDSREYQMAGGVCKSDSEALLRSADRIRRSQANRSKAKVEELSEPNDQTA